MPEKGVRTLLAAWEKVGDIPLKIAGEGPLLEEMRTWIGQRGLQHVELLGQLSRPDVYEVLREARVLIFPSAWSEPFGMILAEAFACGVPAIASRLGAMAEIVHDGQTGLHFTPGDPSDLAAKVLWAFTHPELVEQMVHRARHTFESNYHAEETIRCSATSIRSPSTGRTRGDEYKAAFSWGMNARTRARESCGFVLTSPLWLGLRGSLEEKLSPFPMCSPKVSEMSRSLRLWLAGALYAPAPSGIKIIFPCRIRKRRCVKIPRTLLERPTTMPCYAACMNKVELSS